PRRPGRVADRSGPVAARWRGDRGPHRPGGDVAGVVERGRQVGDGGGDASRGDPRGGPAGSGRPAEVLLAYRRRADRPDGHALPRRVLDVAALKRLWDRGLLTGNHREDLLRHAKHPASHVGPVIARPIQLKTDHPWLLRLVNGIPAECQITGQTTGFCADVRPDAAG